MTNTLPRNAACALREQQPPDSDEKALIRQLLRQFRGVSQKLAKLASSPASFTELNQLTGELAHQVSASASERANRRKELADELASLNAAEKQLTEQLASVAATGEFLAECASGRAGILIFPAGDLTEEDCVILECLCDAFYHPGYRS